MELWRLRAREFLSARSTHDNREVEKEESLAEALSSPNSAPMNWRQRDGDRHRDREETTLSERGCGVEEKPLRCPFVLVCHLFILQGNLGFDSQDQIRCGISQLPNVLIDVTLHLHPHVVVHVSFRRAGRERRGGGGETQNKSAVDASWHFYPIQRSKQKNGASNLQDCFGFWSDWCFLSALTKWSIKNIISDAVQSDYSVLLCVTIKRSQIHSCEQ